MQVLELNFEKLKELDDIPMQSLLNRLCRQFQSSNINFLLGAGFSVDVLGLLGDFEKQLCDAQTTVDIFGGADAIKNLRDLEQEFFKTAIQPLADQEKIKIGESERIVFISHLAAIIRNRQSAILHKIVNVFTTNYDLLLETALEKSHTDYVDGFSGKLRPTFSTANYGMVFSRQTSISSMTSEVVTFNLYKVHGSLNWKAENDAVVYCDHITSINKIGNALNTDEFSCKYSQLAIINPTKEKLNTTVLNANYYDQLRMFCNELEKSNTVLFAFGFSFNDEHIRQMTERSLKGNPTLSLIIFSFNAESTNHYKALFESYPNVTIIQLVKLGGDEENGGDWIPVNCTLDKLNAILEEILNGTK